MRGQSASTSASARDLRQVEPKHPEPLLSIRISTARSLDDWSLERIRDNSLRGTPLPIDGLLVAAQLNKPLTVYARFTVR